MTEQLLDIPIEWHTSEDIVSKFANQIVVQHTEHEFVISFFEVQPPILLGSSEEKMAKVEQMGSVRAECVARIAVAAGRMPEFVRVLQENLKRYSQKVEEENE